MQQPRKTVLGLLLLAVLAVVSFALLGSAAAQVAPPGCTVDSDCPADHVCAEAKCVAKEEPPADAQQ